MNNRNRTRTQAAAPAAGTARRAQRGFVRGAFLAGLAGLVALLLAAAPAEAQVSFSASTNIDRDASAPGVQINEGDTVVITFTASGLPTGGVIARAGVDEGATGTSVEPNDLTSFAFHTSAASSIDELPKGSGISSATLIAGSNNFRVTVVTTQDTTPEPDETFTVATERHIPSAGVTVTPGSITITILANDGYSRASLGGADATLNEGATVNVPVNFQDTAARTADATVAFSITGTATAADYSVTTGSGVSFDASAETGSITVAAAASSGAIPITITSDSADDEGETLIVTLTSYTGGGSGISGAVDSATRTYTLADPARTLTVTGPATIAEDGDTGGVESADYTVTLTGTAFTTATDVTWTVAHGATDGTTDADFAAASDRSGTVTFGPSDGDNSTKTFTLTVANDNLNEAAETFTVQASVEDADADGGTAFGAAHTTTITDDDPIAVTVTASEGTANAAGEVTCAAGSSAAATVTEGRYACLNLDLGAIPTQNVRIVYGSDALVSSATDDVDATVNGPGKDLGEFSNTAVITIAANADPPVGVMTVLVTDDNLNESAEVFRVPTFANAIAGHGTVTVGGGASADAVFTIAESDPITYAIARADGTAATLTEGQPARFQVTLSGATDGSAAQIMVPYTVTSSGAYNVDMSERTGTVDFAAGETSMTLELDLPNDRTMDSGSPMLTVTLGEMPTLSGTPTPGGSVTRATAAADQSARVTVNLVAADHIFTLSNPTLRVTEPASGTNTITYTMNRNGPTIASGDTLQVGASFTYGTAAADDFSPADAGGFNLTFQFTGTETSEDITFDIAADALNEPDETFTVTFSNSSGDSNTNDNGRLSVTAAITVPIDATDPVTVAIARASDAGA